MKMLLKKIWVDVSSCRSLLLKGDENVAEDYLGRCRSLLLDLYTGNFKYLDDGLIVAITITMIRN